MGEAKRRRELLAANPVVYHHTSTLRTNLLWMSGVIALEGDDTPVLHPKLGQLKTDTKMRREMRDFPPLAWFTTQISPPRCLTDAPVFGIQPETGKRIDLVTGAGAMNMIALNRVAIGFAVASIPVVPWTQHPGYQTPEGATLNDSARDFGDNPDDWYVSEEPIDLMLATEIWTAASIVRPKMERQPGYLGHMKAMVERCRSEQGVFIPPSWLPIDKAKAVASRMGVEVRMADEV